MFKIVLDFTLDAAKLVLPSCEIRIHTRPDGAEPPKFNSEPTESTKPSEPTEPGELGEPSGSIHCPFKTSETPPPSVVVPPGDEQACPPNQSPQPSGSGGEKRELPLQESSASQYSQPKRPRVESDTKSGFNSDEESDSNSDEESDFNSDEESDSNLDEESDSNFGEDSASEPKQDSPSRDRNEPGCGENQDPADVLGRVDKVVRYIADHKGLSVMAYVKGSMDTQRIKHSDLIKFDNGPEAFCWYLKGLDPQSKGKITFDVKKYDFVKAMMARTGTTLDDLVYADKRPKTGSQD